MIKAIALSLPAILFSVSGIASDLERLTNGSIADAEKVMAHIDHLQDQIDNIISSGSCSAIQQDNNVLIECANGTSGVIAGAGTVVLYPEGKIGEVPANTLPQGSFAVIDANDVPLAGLNINEAPSNITLDGPAFRALLSPDNIDSMIVNLQDVEQVLLTGTTNQPVYYSTSDCSGVPYSKGHTAGWLRHLGDDSYFILAAATQQFQAKSLRLAGYFETSNQTFYPAEACEETNVAVNAGPLSEFVVPEEIQNAAYPARAEQLP